MLEILGKLINLEPDQLADNLRENVDNLMTSADIIAMGGRDVSQAKAELEKCLKIIDLALEWGGSMMETLFGQVFLTIASVSEDLERY